jgi:hypothetical protein
VALIQYGSFIIVAIGLGAAVMGCEALPTRQHLAAAGNVMWLVCLVCLALIAIVYSLSGAEWKKLEQEPTASTVRKLTGKLMNPTPVQGTDGAEMEITLDKPATLSKNSRVLAVVKPTDQDSLRIVHCRIEESSMAIQITFSNRGTQPITPTAGEQYEIFVY